VHCRYVPRPQPQDTKYPQTWGASGRGFNNAATLIKHRTTATQAPLTYDKRLVGRHKHPCPRNTDEPGGYTSAHLTAAPRAVVRCQDKARPGRARELLINPQTQRAGPKRAGAPNPKPHSALERRPPLRQQPAQTRHRRPFRMSGHPHTLDNFAVYGLSVIYRSLSLCDPRALHDWLVASHQYSRRRTNPKNPPLRRSGLLAHHETGAGA
jgi:hypothetical protein